MNVRLRYAPLAFALAAGLTGCPGDDGTAGDGNDATTGSPGEDSSTGGAPTSGTPTTSDPDSTGGSSAAVTSGPPGTGSSGSDGSGGSTGDDPFVFDESPPETYEPIDRVGNPAANTGLNLSGDKDAYNADMPDDDANLAHFNDLNLSLEVWHLGTPGMQVADNTGLDDDLLALGLSPCTPPPGAGSDCDNQSGPYIVPDTLKIDLDEPAGFPNGRRPTDAVMDPLLAMILVDLSVENLDVLFDIDGVGTPLNPDANDVMLPATWPFLAAAH